MARIGRYTDRALASVDARFDAKVRVMEDGCHEWQGYVGAKGYGVFGTGGRKLMKAHRYAYIRTKGEVPSGLQLDHLCRNRRCVNPEHLDPVTNRENVIRGNEARPVRTHCRAGHEFSAENTYIHPKRGTRHCKACQAARSKRA